MARKTPLYRKHLEAGARMTEFAGWDMPVHYGSVIREHEAVRRHAGVFDVSHMTIVDVLGSASTVYLQYLLANDPGRLEPGQAQYSAMLNDEAGVVDDLIVYRTSEGYRLVTNAATREKDLQWLRRHGEGFQVDLRERSELAMLAVHGPESIERVAAALLQTGFSGQEAEQAAALASFRCQQLGGWFIARTGYTGEQGLELILPEEEAPALWETLLNLGVTPVGLGARDTLRLEAGMNLYGHEMDESVSPLSANMARTIAWQPEDRDFIGRRALARHYKEEDALPKLVGLVMEQRGVLREGQKVLCDVPGGEEGDREGGEEGVVTSGTFSPILKHSIALARVPARARQCRVDVRGRITPVRMVDPVFVRAGKSVLE